MLHSRKQRKFDAFVFRRRPSSRSSVKPTSQPSARHSRRRTLKCVIVICVTVARGGGAILYVPLLIHYRCYTFLSFCRTVGSVSLTQ